jgi:sulfofructose kinase
MERTDDTATERFVLCVGAAALDLVMDVDSIPTEDTRVSARAASLAGGGPAATAAVALGRLGTRVSFAGWIGEDAAGILIREGLVAENVDVAHLRSEPGAASAMALGLVRSTNGTRTLVAYAGSTARAGVTPELEALARAADWIHADHAGYPVVRELRRRGVETPVSLDGGNPIPDLDLTLIDLYAPAAAELLRWSQAPTVEAGLAKAVSAGASVAIATHGETGSTAVSVIEPDGVDVTTAVRAARIRTSSPRTWSIEQSAFPMDATSGSTLGAGDVFHGALLAAILQGRSLRDAMAFASAAASLSCRALDGRSAIPTIAEVDDLVGRHAPAAGSGSVAWT